MSYRMVFPDSKIDDYSMDMNRECTYHEYREMVKSRLIEMERWPTFFRAQAIHFNMYVPVLNAKDRLTIKDYVETTYFEEHCRKDFDRKVKGYLLNQRTFTLVEALESFCNFFSYGDVTQLPKRNFYIPNKVNITPKPKFNDEHEDTLNVNRIGPNGYLTSNKAYSLPFKA